MLTCRYTTIDHIVRPFSPVLRQHPEAKRRMLTSMTPFYQILPLVVCGAERRGLYTSRVSYA